MSHWPRRLAYDMTAVYEHTGFDTTVEVTIDAMPGGLAELDVRVAAKRP